MKKLLVLLSFFLLVSCFGLIDSNSERVIGNYIVVWIDLPANQSLSEEFERGSSGSSEIVPDYVFAVGHNEDYIIAKQHPTNGSEGGFVVDTTVTNYYIVDMNRKILKKRTKVFGHLNQNQFESLTRKLKIESLEFDQVYSNQP